jgi:hypothetical protein
MLLDSFTVNFSEGRPDNVDHAKDGIVCNDRQEVNKVEKDCSKEETKLIVLEPGLGKC